MMRNKYLPEGYLLDTPFNTGCLKSTETLCKAKEEGVILEGRCLVCDEDMNLHIDLGFARGIIPRSECAYTHDGIIKDIAVISRVGKPICFKVVSVGDGQIQLSRKAAQKECMENYISSLCAGDVIPARMTHFESYGGFADIGCGIISLMSIDCMSVSRISHPSDRFCIGQRLMAVVRSGIDESGYVSISHKELLGSWQENAQNFSVGQTVAGIVRSVESYGVFVELSPNLAGLAEYKENVSVGMYTAVYIKSIIPSKMKIKLVIVDVGDKAPVCTKYTYPQITHIDRFVYSPEQSERVIETVF